MPDLQAAIAAEAAARDRARARLFDLYRRTVRRG
jgi:hypothetical protein